MRGDAAAKRAVSWARPQDDGRKPRILDIYNYLCVLGIHVCVYVYVMCIYIYIYNIYIMYVVNVIVVLGYRFWTQAVSIW